MKKEYVITDDAGTIATTEAAQEKQEAHPWGALIKRTHEGKNPEGVTLMGYRALDTDELLWVGTIEDALKWANARMGIEPIDRHAAYWERRYAARRYARRMGVLPTYTDLFEAYKMLHGFVEGTSFRKNSTSVKALDEADALVDPAALEERM